MGSSFVKHGHFIPGLPTGSSEHKRSIVQGSVLVVKLRVSSSVLWKKKLGTLLFLIVNIHRWFSTFSSKCAVNEKIQ